MRLYGTGVSALRGADLTGRFLDEPDALPPGLWPQFEASYREAIATRGPLTRSLPYRRPTDEAGEWHHSRVILPFARADGHSVEILLVAFIPSGGERPGSGPGGA